MPDKYGVWFEFDELPKRWTDSAQTFFSLDGNSSFALPPGWVAGQNSAGMTQLTADLQSQSSRFLRQTLDGGFSLALPENLDFSASFADQTKNGRYLEGAVMGLTGGNPRSVTLNDRVDYTTDLWKTALDYAVDEFQLNFEYQGSHFENNDSSVTWENPYLANAAWSPNAGYPPSAPCFGVTDGCGLGRKGEAPGNWFNQIIASGGYNLPWNTRVMANAAFGWMVQNDTFLPYTVNQALLAPIPLPRSSLDGQINTTVLNFVVASRPLPNTRVDLRYRYDDRQNQTPRDTYVYIRNDSENQGTIDGGTARVNRPYSYTEHQFDFDVGYTLFERTELTVGYAWNQIHRDLQEVEDQSSNAVFAELYSHPLNWLTARGHFRHTWRDRSTYIGVKPQLVGDSPESLVGFDPNTEFENHPALRKFYMQGGEREDVGSMITISPIDKVGIGLQTDYYHDAFDGAQVGLTDRDVITTGVDLSYAPCDRLFTHAFYNYERFNSNQTGWSWNNLATAADPGRQWSGRQEDRVHTVGAGAHFDVIPDVLGLDTQYVYSRATWHHGTRSGPDARRDHHQLPVPGHDSPTRTT